MFSGVDRPLTPAVYRIASSLSSDHLYATFSSTRPGKPASPSGLRYRIVTVPFSSAIRAMSKIRV